MAPALLALVYGFNIKPILSAIDMGNQSSAAYEFCVVCERPTMLSFLIVTSTHTNFSAFILAQINVILLDLFFFLFMNMALEHGSFIHIVFHFLHYLTLLFNNIIDNKNTICVSVEF